MKLKIGEKSDALYLRLDDSKIIESEEVSPGGVLDFNEHGQAVGSKMLSLSQPSPRLNLRDRQFQSA
jgi:uncharacterized protein YuzE